VKIAFVTEYYRPFEVGGAERSAERLAVELVRRGTPVTVYTPNYGAVTSESRDGVEVRRLPFPQRLVPGQLARRSLLANPLLHAVYAVLLGRALRRTRVDVLHVQNSGLLPAASVAARLAGVPLVLTVRDLAYLRRGAAAAAVPSTAVAWKWRLDGWWAAGERWVRRRALRRARRVVFVSQALCELYTAAGEIPAGTAAVVHNIGPRPGGAAAHRREPDTVLFVGKLSTGKGLHVLYEAARELRARRPNVRITLAGLPGVGFEPPPPALAEAFVLLGRVDEEEVRERMQRTAVLVAPAIWPEPLSRVLLEAMTLGTPIVATRAGGNEEALAGGAGHLVPPGDAAALAAGLLAVLTDDALASRLSTAARERAAGFSPEAVLPRVLQVYEEARERR
jgi:glycogen(starch) synthase